jgi:hypothetical protein
MSGDVNEFILRSPKLAALEQLYDWDGLLSLDVMRYHSQFTIHDSQLSKK